MAEFKFSPFRTARIVQIAMSWISTLIGVAPICFVILFIMQNVFEQRVFVVSSVSYAESQP